MEAKHYFPDYPKLKTEKGVWREDYWCGGKEVGVAASPPYFYLYIIGDLSPFIELKETLMESSISQRNNNGILRTTKGSDIPHLESGAFRIQEVDSSV